MYMVYPKLEADIYFNEQPPPYLPYTEKTVKNIAKPFMGSTAEIRLVDMYCYYRNQNT